MGFFVCFFCCCFCHKDTAISPHAWDCSLKNESLQWTHVISRLGRWSYLLSVIYQAHLKAIPDHWFKYKWKAKQGNGEVPLYSFWYWTSHFFRWQTLSNLFINVKFCQLLNKLELCLVYKVFFLLHQELTSMLWKNS